MMKGLKIVGFLTVLLAFVACEKCDKPVSTEDPFTNATNRATHEQDYSKQTSADHTSTLKSGGSTDGTITDPNEDEDFDGIVDPDEDGDFDQDGK